MELFQYQEIAYVTVPSQVSVAEVRVESWMVASTLPLVAPADQHQSFFGEPWLASILFEIPELDEWWNRSLDAMPVVSEGQVIVDSLSWYPESYVAEVPSMATWYVVDQNPETGIHQTDGYFSLGIPPSTTFTEAQCPYRPPRADDEDELRFRTQ